MVVLNGYILNYTGLLTNNGTITYSEFGNSYNNYRNLTAIGCRYGLYLEPGDSVKNSSPPPNAFSGWCNENNFWGGRIALVSGLQDPENFQAIHVQWQMVGTPGVAEAHGPNNNRFYGISLEGVWGRKIFCEGLDNIWVQCRYETPNTGTDIEFANTIGGISGSGNVLLYGNGLSGSVVISTGPGAVRNQKITTPEVDLSTATLSSAAIKTRNPAGGSSSILRVQNQAGTEDRVVARESIPGAPDPVAGWTFHGAGGTQQNALYLKAATQVAVLNGLVVNDAGGDFDTRVAGDGESSLLFVDASTDRIGIGTPSPLVRAHISGPHVVGLGTLAVVNANDNAYVTLDHGAANWNGGLQIKQGGVQKVLVDHVQNNDYLRIYAYGVPGEVLIAPVGTGWVGLPHGTVPAKPGDLPAAELDLYDGRIAQMGWHRLATQVGGTHTTSKEVIIGVKQTPKNIILAASDRIGGRIFVIKDETGTAGQQDLEIRIDAEGANIDGSSSGTYITQNYGFVALYCDGSNWFVIGRS
jgi:hypothetical protein